MKLTILISVLLFSVCLCAQDATPAPGGQARPERGQRGPGGRGGFGGGTTGTISEIKDNVITIKTSDGKTLTVKTSADTRIMGKDRTPIAIKDLKVGDSVMAGGQTAADGAIEARMVALLDEEAVKRMKDAQANMGKTMIAGEVKEIKETNITVLRPDGQTQVITVDENTSLKKQGESITLADIKAGDRISGPGELKDGVFVAKEIRVGMPQRRPLGDGPRPDGAKPEKQ
jgi:preprotein translocase subunit YajC